MRRLFRRIWELRRRKASFSFKNAIIWSEFVQLALVCNGCKSKRKEKVDEKNLTITFTLFKSIWNHLSQPITSAVFDIQVSAVKPIRSIVIFRLSIACLADV